MFTTRSQKLERIDTGDYTREEYERFLKEIRFINRYLGDCRAVRKTLLRDVEKNDTREFSILDVAAGSGELLRYIAEFARESGRKAWLIGIDLSEISALAAHSASHVFPEVSSVRGDAFRLPFADNSFDYALSSLFLHHLTDDQIPIVLKEMSRVARRGIYVIDLHRHNAAYVFYKLFCFAFRISPLVKQDGLLSILRGFRPGELNRNGEVTRTFPFRLVYKQTAIADKFPGDDRS